MTTKTQVYKSCPVNIQYHLVMHEMHIYFIHLSLTNYRGYENEHKLPNFCLIELHDSLMDLKCRRQTVM